MPSDFSIILASQSPRRRELLKRLVPEFEVHAAAVDEVLVHEDGCPALALHNAQLKARFIAERYPDSWIIGSDTVVECDGLHLAKPESRDHAKVMLRTLSGRKHHVHTGIALCCQSMSVQDTAVETSEVAFFQLDEQTLETYVATIDASHYAGGYAIQYLLGSLVSGFDGSFTNVVGLPVERLEVMLRRRSLLPSLF